MNDQRYQSIVVGAGFGGLASALSLAERGHRVLLLEALNYPGGCASTFKRGAYRFETGATLFSGFSERGLFQRWAQRHHFNIEIQHLDPALRFRSPALEIDIPLSRELFVEGLCALRGAPKDELRAFFSFQASVADLFWKLLDSPELLPPLSFKSLLAHRRLLTKFSWLKYLGQPLSNILQKFKLQHFEPLRHYLDGVCQITLQCPSHEVEGLMALATMDYFFRGTVHLKGGIGTLAHAMCDALTECGGDYIQSTRVKHISPEGECYRVETTRGVFKAKNLVLNVLPQTASTLLAKPLSTKLQSRVKKIESGWSACMLYCALDQRHPLPSSALHYELVDNADDEFIEGNHIFCSLAGEDEVGRAPPGQRVMTVSTHMRLANGLPTAQAVQDVHQRMRKTIQRRAPELHRAICFSMSASPRTFERFTKRPFGMVGGIPQRAGLGRYRNLAPTLVMPNIYLVGDSVFPGQSTLAVALGGHRVASSILKKS